MTEAKKPKKRFTAEQQIINAIDLCYRRAGRLTSDAEVMDLQADALFKKANIEEDTIKRAGFAKEAGQLRLKAQKARKFAHNAIENKARKLGEKLAEFRTALMFAGATGTGDESIPT